MVYGDIFVTAVFRKQFAPLYWVRFASKVSASHLGCWPSPLCRAHESMHEVKVYCRDEAISARLDLKSVWQKRRKVFSEAAAGLVYSVPLIAGQSRERMP